MTENNTSATFDANAGAAIYSKATLLVYDLWVLGFSNSFVWRCPTRLILDHYNRHITGNHLDVGVGTGYYLDKCRFPSPNPQITLMDLNANSLQKTSNRLSRYAPRIQPGNALEPLPFESQRFDSIGINFLLHCLPGTMASKEVVFANLKNVLNDGGVIFGTTILGEGVEHNPVGKLLMRIYNNKGIFANRQDDIAGLDAHLRAHFAEYSTQMMGRVALFSARK